MAPTSCENMALRGYDAADNRCFPPPKHTNKHHALQSPTPNTTP